MQRQSLELLLTTFPQCMNVVDLVASSQVDRGMHLVPWPEFKHLVYTCQIRNNGRQQRLTPETAHGLVSSLRRLSKGDCMSYPTGHSVPDIACAPSEQAHRAALAVLAHSVIDIRQFRDDDVFDECLGICNDNISVLVQAGAAEALLCCATDVLDDDKIQCSAMLTLSQWVRNLTSDETSCRTGLVAKFESLRIVHVLLNLITASDSPKLQQTAVRLLASIAEVMPDGDWGYWDDKAFLALIKLDIMMLSWERKAMKAMNTDHLDILIVIGHMACNVPPAHPDILMVQSDATEILLNALARVDCEDYYFILRVLATLTASGSQNRRSFVRAGGVLALMTLVQDEGGLEPVVEVMEILEVLFEDVGTRVAITSSELRGTLAKILLNERNADWKRFDVLERLLQSPLLHLCYPGDGEPAVDVANCLLVQNLVSIAKSDVAGNEEPGLDESSGFPPAASEGDQALQLRLFAAQALRAIALRRTEWITSRMQPLGEWL